MALTDTKCGGYYLPNPALPEGTEQRTIGNYGRRHGGLS
jgi:hypothetical protein